MGWSKRLAEICRKAVYEKIGEDEFYEAFHKIWRAEEDGAAVGANDSLHAFCESEEMSRVCSEDMIAKSRPPPRVHEDEETASSKSRPRSKPKKKEAKKAEKKSIQKTASSA